MAFAIFMSHTLAPLAAMIQSRQLTPDHGPLRLWLTSLRPRCLPLVYTLSVTAVLFQCPLLPLAGHLALTPLSPL